MTTSNFWQKNQVLISALVGAVTIVLQQFMTQTEYDFKAIGLALLIAIAGVIGNQFRGKGVTVAGFLGAAALAFNSVYQTGNFTWNQFIIAVVLGFLALVAPPPKSDAYEKTDIIQEAKNEAAAINNLQKKTP